MSLPSQQGFNHTCADPSAHGAAKCWGWNREWTAGRRQRQGSYRQPACSGHRADQRGHCHLSRESGHTCAIHNGAAKCWGLEPTRDGWATAPPASQPYSCTGFRADQPVSLPSQQGLSTLVPFIMAPPSAGGITKERLSWVDGIAHSTTKGRSEPVQVSGLTSNVTAISAGRFPHLCHS